MKKLVSMVLTVGMVSALLAGCGSTENAANDNADTKSSSDSGVADANGTDSEADEDADDEDEDAEHIVVALCCLTQMDEAVQQRMEDALNEMMLEKINVEADFQWYDMNTYSTTVPMMITANDPIDVVMFTPIPAIGYQSYMSQNQLADITDAIENYGPDIQNVMGDYLKATSRDGRVYGVGYMSSMYSQAKIVMNKDVLDELNLTEEAEAIDSWDDYEALLKKVVAQTDLSGIINSDAIGSVTGPAPYVLSDGDFSNAGFVDTVGDSFNYVYADPETDEIKCYFENEKWYENIKLAHKFYDEGLIYKDAAVAQDYAATLLKNDVGFSGIWAVELGGEANTAATTGHNILAVDIKAAELNTYTFTKWGMAVPVTSEHVDAAVKFINLLYGDAEFADTITWGIEGVDWVKDENGMATYPEGINGDNVEYHTADFLYGNVLIKTPWQGPDVDIREHQKEANASMEVSKFLGFNIDSTPVSNELTACKNVVDQYKPQLSAGTVEDVDKTYNEFIDALYAAGMQKILDAYNEQLQAWLAEQ